MKKIGVILVLGFLLSSCSYLKEASEKLNGGCKGEFTPINEVQHGK